MAYWHGLAKLHMHTDTTLARFSQVTTSFGNSIRKFQEKTCKAFSTRELERERTARMRRQEKNVETSTRQKHNGSARKPKQLSLKTYKFHALGDYVYSIRRFGTTDSYSTQPVCSSWHYV